MKTFFAYIEFDPETKRYVGSVPSIPGAHTQGETLDELHDNLKEVLELCLEEYGDDLDELPHFDGRTTTVPNQPRPRFVSSASTRDSS